jgi:hypothetical protein
MLYRLAFVFDPKTAAAIQFLYNFHIEVKYDDTDFFIEPLSPAAMRHGHGQGIADFIPRDLVTRKGSIAEGNDRGGNGGEAGGYPVRQVFSHRAGQKMKRLCTLNVLKAAVLPGPM